MTADPSGGLLLVADIGATKARFALIGPDRRPHSVHLLKAADYADLAGAIDAYLSEVDLPEPPSRAAVGIASPIRGDRVAMTNLHWDFSIEETRRVLGLDRLRVLNDLAAMALALPHLEAGHLRKLGGGEPLAGTTVAVVAPGTGLGVAGLMLCDGDPVHISGEGGHATMAAGSADEAAVLERVRARFGHASAERVLAGPGLVNLYVALCELNGSKPDPDIRPADVSERGRDGSSPECERALALHSRLLGSFAGNVALMFGAFGGVYIAGGVVPRLGVGFDERSFRERFEAKGRFEDYLVKIPTYLVTHERLAFLGLAHAL